MGENGPTKPVLYGVKKDAIVWHTDGAYNQTLGTHGSKQSLAVVGAFRFNLERGQRNWKIEDLSFLVMAK